MRQSTPPDRGNASAASSSWKRAQTKTKKSALPPGQPDSTSSSPSPSTSRAVTTAERDLLAFFSHISRPVIAAPDFTETLQKVKGALYNKDYTLAFSSRAFLDAYFARWVPSRALGYRRILAESEVARNMLQSSDSCTVICVGGGAGSEVMALASMAREHGGATTQTKVIAVDVASWGDVLDGALESVRASAANGGLALSTDRFEASFLLSNVLDESDASQHCHSPAETSTPSNLPVSSEASSAAAPSDPQPDRAIPWASASLITIFFTISELFLESRAKTLALLGRITHLCRPGTLLFIVESVGLSDLPIGNGGRSYPLPFILDHALTSASAGEKRWETVRAEDSIWYRLSDGAADCYPLKLENMRVLLRLYRRL